MMLGQSTVEMAERDSEQRIDPPIERLRTLREVGKCRRSRNSGQTRLSNAFSSDAMAANGASSAVGLRSMAVRGPFLDGIDAFSWEVFGEGDSIPCPTRTFA
jgi:phage terminase large subunit GpA-like protein